MRRALFIWCVLGALFIGLKATLDRMALKYPDVAVRAGADVYFIPRRMIESEGWRADVMRLTGCWDARVSGVLPIGCGSGRAVRLEIPAKDLGPGVEIGLRGHPLRATFWPAYVPPDDHLRQLMQAWAGTAAWTGRKLIMRADWQLFRFEAPGTPWVYLLSNEPRAGTPDELATLYAGRCYRPEPLSDAGITCDFVLSIAPGAALEYALGPDEIMSMVMLRDGLVAVTSSWRNPAPTVGAPRQPIVAQIDNR